MTTEYKIDEYGMRCYYDDNGNIIRREDTTTSFVEQFEYDDKGRLLHYIASDRTYIDEQYYQYDDNGRIVYESDSLGVACHYKYHNNGIKSYTKEYYCGELDAEYWYDETGKIIESKYYPEY